MLHKSLIMLLDTVAYKPYNVARKQQIEAPAALERDRGTATRTAKETRMTTSIVPPSSPTSSSHDLRVAFVLERLAQENAQNAAQAGERAASYKAQARKAWGLGDFERATDLGRAADQEAHEAAFFKRGRTAYTNALTYWNRGIRPDQLKSGAYILPSVVSGKSPHLIVKNGDWICCCDAGSQFHWPIAMLVALEIAGDETEAHDDGEAAWRAHDAEMSRTCACYDTGTEQPACLASGRCEGIISARAIEQAAAEAAPMLAGRAERLAQIEAEAAEWF
jgi:hypothetical protein